MSAGIERGPVAVRRLLDERLRDVRELELPGFRSWLEDHLARWTRDPELRQRVRIRGIRRAHPHLRAAEAAHREALAADRGSPGRERLEQLQREMEGAARAVEGLTAALGAAAPDRAQELRAKLADFQRRLRVAQEEHRTLTLSSPQRLALLRAAEALEQLREQSGLAREEERLALLQAERGRGAGRRGADFEELALAATRRHLLPDLDQPGLRILQGVTLGAARTELDQLVVRTAAKPDEPVEVLALVEAKRNLNDLAHGFRQRQENLAWLTGAERGYDPAAFRTAFFTSGHFDRPAEHRQEGERFLLCRDSFRRFRPDPATGLFLEGLHLVTRPGTLWGLSGGALARVAHRVATDEEWDPTSDRYLAGLFAWCRSLAGPLESPDVLRAYLAAGRAGQLWLLEG